MLPPIGVCKPAPMVPGTERERTMMPRTTPRVADDAVAVEFERRALSRFGQLTALEVSVWSR